MYMNFLALIMSDPNSSYLQENTSMNSAQLFAAISIISGSLLLLGYECRSVEKMHQMVSQQTSLRIYTCRKTWN